MCQNVFLFRLRPIFTSHRCHCLSIDPDCWMMVDIIWWRGWACVSVCACACVRWVGCNGGVDESGLELRETESFPLQAHKQLDKNRKGGEMKTEGRQSEMKGGRWTDGGEDGHNQETTDSRDGQVGRKSIDFSWGSNQMERMGEGGNTRTVDSGENTQEVFQRGQWEM